MAWPEKSAKKQQAALAAIRMCDMVGLAESKVTPQIFIVAFCPKNAMIINLTVTFWAQLFSSLRCR